MYSQQELDDAVVAGVISADAADALRRHVEGQRSLAIAAGGATTLIGLAGLKGS